MLWLANVVVVAAVDALRVIQRKQGLDVGQYPVTISKQHGDRVIPERRTS